MGQSGDTDYYEIVQSAAMLEIVPGLKTSIWGYNGTFPGNANTDGTRSLVVRARVITRVARAIGGGA
jgi:spore coat protein A